MAYAWHAPRLKNTSDRLFAWIRSKNTFTLYPMLFVFGLTMSGCGITGPKVAYPTDISTVEQQARQASEQVYTVIAGNKLDVKFYYTPELNERVTVRPDGRISLQLINDVMAAGRTPEDLAQLLEQRYAKELKTPEIAVIVADANQQVFVQGEVGKPGAIALEGPLTVLQAIAYSGGFTDRARRDSIILIRRSQPSEPLVIPLDIEKVYDGSSLAQDLMLAHFDIIHVPRSPIANINLWIDQYIRRNIPAPAFFTDPG